MKLRHIVTFLALGGSLALCPAMHAQDASPSPATTGTDNGGRQGGRGGRGGGMTLERLTTELGLTDDEQAKIKPILDKLRTDMQAMRADTTTSPQDKMAKMRQERQDSNSQIRELLTPDQQTKFDALVAQMRNRRGGGGGGGGGGGQWGGGGGAGGGASPAGSP